MDLVLDGIAKSFGPVQALHPLTLHIPSGALVALLGPSGCGKTTTLRIIAGFEQADSGQVRVGGADITRLPPHKRRLGMVFQNYSLFPHMTVSDNVAFGLRRAGCPRAEVATRVAQALDMVRLSGMAARWPSQLSGGQQQRVALARSLVTNPSVLLLDEPLGALDKNLRESMQFELRQLQRTLGITTVLVTHDQEEALTMADHVAVMHDGRLQQVGPPDQVYDRPANRVVAEFLGTSNVLAATAITTHAATLDGTDLPLTLPTPARPGARLHLAIRPERLLLSPEPPAANALPATITGIVFRGSYRAIQLALPTGQTLFAYVAPQSFLPTLTPGTPTYLSWLPEDAVLLASPDL